MTFTEQQYERYIRLLQSSDTDQNSLLNEQGFTQQELSNYPDAEHSEIWSPTPIGVGYSRPHALFAAFLISEKGTTE